MENKSLTPRSIILISLLMENETVAEKVKAAGDEGKSYAIYKVCEKSGNIILGETRYEFWNRLIGCQKVLPFESWALAVWDALVSLSTGDNAVAIEEGLSVEIAKATREGRYNWVVERLVDVYDHFANNKDGGAPLAGGREKSGPSVVVGKVSDPVVVNVNVSDKRRVFRFPDATGRAFLNIETGIVGLGVSKVEE